MTSSGMLANMTSVRSHPLINATINPPKNVDISCKNFPTFSPMASWIRTVSPDILPTISPVFVSLSKKPTSCLRIVFKYKLLIREACLSPVTIQQATWRNDATAHPTAKYTNFRHTLETTCSTCLLF
uniref:Uncharacterized protein n=1 Tax=Rhizophora mucronata TaxID=61149 RepID=A0A2P2QTA8_RHIMU